MSDTQSHEQCSAVRGSQGTVTTRVYAPLTVRTHPPRLWFTLSRALLYAIMIMTYLASGLISLYIPFYRLAPVSLIALPLLLRYRISMNVTMIVFILLFIVIGASALVNGSSLLDMAIFCRIPLFALLIWLVVQRGLETQNAIGVLRACYIIALIQLPVVLVQRSSYAALPPAWQHRVSLEDFDFGTFNLKTDYSTAFFCCLFLAWILFDKRSRSIIRYRVFSALWLTFTILFINSEISKVLLLLIWIIYLYTLAYRHTFAALCTIILVLLALGFAMLLDLNPWAPFAKAALRVAALTDQFGPQGLARYRQGLYSRGGALYSLFTDVKLLGDGPLAYFDPVSRTLLRGNTGHVYTFWSEIGVLGFASSIAVFVAIAFSPGGWRLRARGIAALALLGVLALAFTAEVMNDISVFLTFCIMTRISNIAIPIREATTTPVRGAAKSRLSFGGEA
jgi:hypothetical protein